MKFICENCKAKYQIGDEKVAGKTVRMKCRRCGHLIEVSASVTETSVSRPPPADPAYQAPHAVAPMPEAQPFPRREEDPEERTMIMSGPPVRLAKPAGPTPAAGAPPRPGAPTSGGAPARAAPAPRPQGVAALRSVPSPRPGVAAAAARPAPRPAEQGFRAVDAPLGIAPKVAGAPNPAGLAGAFSRVITQPAAAPVRQTPSENWYVGVAGVPLGPIRLSVIREKAAFGAVDGDSLVWREGYDEWQPLKNFPELLEIVTEAQASRVGGRRPSGVGMQPAPQLSSSPSAEASASRPSPYGALGAAALTAAAPLVAATPEPAPAHAPIAPAAVAGPVDVMADPFAAPKVAPESASGPFAAPAPLDLARASVPPQHKRGLHPMAYAFIAMAAVFGAVAGYVLLVKPPPAPQVVYVPGATVIVHDQAPTPEGSAAPIAAAGDSAAPTSKPVLGGPLGGPRPVDAKSASPSSGAAIDLSGFGSGGVAGPSAQGPNAGGPSGGGGQLSASDISTVVNGNQTIIKRKCWQPALEARAKDGPTTAKVTANLTIGPGGDVQSVSATGGGSFPDLASCIAGRIKGWKFPPSGGSTPVSVPFVFAGQ